MEREPPAGVLQRPHCVIVYSNFSSWCYGFEDSNVAPSDHQLETIVESYRQWHGDSQVLEAVRQTFNVEGVALESRGYPLPL